MSKQCNYCEFTPRELILSDKLVINYDDQIKIKTYVCGNKLYTSAYIENFSENYYDSDEYCNDEGHLELESSTEINFCPMCGRKL